MSLIAKLIDEVVSLDLRKRCKSDGFRKNSRTFVRGENPVHIVNVQASQGNFDTTGQFTLNIGVYFPNVASKRGLVSKGNYPKEYESTWHTRIGALMPGGLDHWWSIGPHTDLASLAQDVGVAYSKLAEPWLREMSDLNKVFAAAERSRDALMAAAIALELGRTTAAAEVLARAYESANQYFQPTILRFAARHGLPSPADQSCTEPPSN